MHKLDQFNNEKINLEILAEEAAEVIQIKSKITRFGIDDHWAKVLLSNRGRLEEETGHFLAMVDILIHQGTISREMVERGREAKFDKLLKWYTKGDSDDSQNP